LTTGRKIWVRESCDEVVRLSLAYQALMRHEAMAAAGNGGG